MMLDLTDPATLARVVGAIIAMIMTAAVGYAAGHKDGSREGYTRGRAIARHSVTRKAVK
jgi:hypothetical protein